MAIFSLNGAAITGHLSGKEMKLNPCLIPHTKINSKCVMNLNVKRKKFKLFISL